MGKAKPKKEETPRLEEDPEAPILSSRIGDTVIMDPDCDIDLDPKIFDCVMQMNSLTTDEEYEWFGRKLLDSGAVVVRRDSFFIIGYEEDTLRVAAQALDFELQVKKPPSEHIMCHYEVFTLDTVDKFKTYQNKTTIFSPASRGRLLFEILEDTIGMKELYGKRSRVESCFLLHDDELKEELDKLAFNPCRSFPVEQIRNYYGEKVAMYFAFIKFYTNWLWLISGFGVGQFIVNRLNRDDIERIYAPLFIIALILWATFFLEFWIRKRVSMAYRWNCEDYEDEAKARVDFKGKPVVNPITNEEEIYFNPWWRRLVLYPISYLTVFSFVVLVVALLVGNTILKMSGVFSPKVASLVCGVGSGLTIFVLNKVYYKVAHALNEMENHRTSIAYTDAFIFKVFTFQFVNSFTMLYYIAFFKGRLSEIFGISSSLDEPCPDNDCEAVLRKQLGTQFGTMIITGQALELGLPYIKMKIKKFLNSRHPHDDKDELGVVKESKMADHDVFDDYAELIIQFGYATLFAAAFPLAPALALLNNIFELPGDFWKMSVCAKRPKPERCQDIGHWLLALKTISYVALFTNVAYLVFVSPVSTVRSADTIAKAFAFFVLEHVFLGIKLLAMWLIPDTPGSVARQHTAKRQLEQLRIREASKKKHEEMRMEMKATENKMDVNKRKKRLPPKPSLPGVGTKETDSLLPKPPGKKK